MSWSVLLAGAAAIIFTAAPAGAQAWKPVEGRLMTRWAKDVTPQKAWPEYPRPSLARPTLSAPVWQNLNGLWEYAVVPADANTNAQAVPASWAGNILVPFAIESSLSGVGKGLEPTEALFYRRRFVVPPDWRTHGQRVLLHFGACDWSTDVAVNGMIVGKHTGGYDPFTLDITDALASGKGEQHEVVVRVTDPTNTGGQPRGKQWLKPHSIWYTRTSGIWQTVWLEPAPATRVVGLVPSGDPQTGEFEVAINATGPDDGISTVVELTASGKVVGSIRNKGLARKVGLKIAAPRAWTPDDPFLYDLSVTLERDSKAIDRVQSYAAFRTVSLGADDQGVRRLMLNGRPVFHFGPLDQGFWPDGIYTPPTEEAMKFDIECVKRAGANMLRKHVKVESDRYYYLCDTMGVMVWQDIPSPFFSAEKWNEGFPALTDPWKTNFVSETERIMDAFGFHPSIVMWLPFNEGWGQNDLAWAKGVVDHVKQRDPSRLVNCATGWTDTGNGDVVDIHVYPGPGTPPREANRAAVLGEFGGLGLPLDGHTWVNKDNWGYVTYKDRAELTEAYVALLNQMPELIAEGLSAAVYTQTTDVEIECNGWLTYDRAVFKVEPVRAREAAMPLYEPPPRLEVVVPRAGQGPAATWWYATSAPPEDWNKPGFDPAKAGWKQGSAGFGTTGTPGASVGQEWSSGEIWLVRQVMVPAGAVSPRLSIHHDEDAEVYINGELAAKLTGYTTSYRNVAISDRAAAVVKGGGSMTIAVHCRQTTGGQYIDVGITDVKPTK